ncbi:hypothetical protein BCR33DRAFT_718720 [Rhizoclosmatium globosum]|uniref:Uncharacterized protein n=1 Tax=Rhizoclosmatium globosum TaxID=329046 RepID=A0A1Y2C3M4_9FUNG|nr:hypothetical protein BCR33DRAFT_718720 [Rhizoclosmatium globosum]|eukprot:ORY41556.1 hypothetical protein BCR33DRAFT_718720 [Rhizoclosmatium globosum]
MAEKIAQLEKRVRELEEENQALKRIKVPDVASPNTPISAYPTSNSFHPQQQHSYPSYPMYAYPPPPPPYPYYYPHPPPHSIPQHAPVMPHWAQPLQPMIPPNMWSAGHPPTTVPAPLPPNTLSSSTSSIALAPIPTPVLQKFESPDLVSPAAERPSGHPSSSGAPPSAM